MKKFMLMAAAAFAVSASASQAAVLYDNGPVVDGSGLSILTPPVSTLGFGAQSISNNAVADNFSIVGAGWNISSLDFYSYQTGSVGFTFTSATWSIVSGNDVNTGVVVASGTTAVTDGGLLGYRVTNTTLTNTQRPIYRLNADVADFSLGAGDYFLTWSLAGNIASGPWVPPVDGSLGAGNGLQATTGGSFNTLVEAGSGLSVELPFSINGAVAGAVPEPATWAMMIGGLGLVGASMRRRSAKVSFA